MADTTMDNDWNGFFMEEHITLNYAKETSYYGH